MPSAPAQHHVRLTHAFYTPTSIDNAITEHRDSVDVIAHQRSKNGTELVLSGAAHNVGEFLNRVLEEAVRERVRIGVHPNS